jgi:hypothetical protein
MSEIRRHGKAIREEILSGKIKENTKARPMRAASIAAKGIASNDDDVQHGATNSRICANAPEIRGKLLGPFCSNSQIVLLPGAAVSGLSSGSSFMEQRCFRRNRDQALLKGKQNQVCIALQIERLHDVVLVEFYGLFTQFQMTGDLLDGAALCE